MGFEYRLERLKKLNESEKKQLERDYQILYEKLETLAKKLVELMKKKDALQKALHDHSQAKVKAFSIHERLKYIETIEKAIEWEQQNYHELKTQVENFRRSLIDKSIEVKKHERLKENAYNQYQVIEKKNELKQMDEHAQLLRNQPRA